MPESEDLKITKKAVTWMHLIIAVIMAIVGAVGLGAKIQFDVNANREAIQEIKRKSEKNNETITTIAKDTAVLTEKTSSVNIETEKISQKVDKIYELLIKDKNNKP